jgi:hypothetical protein
MIREHDGPMAFGARVDEVLPKPSTSLQLRLTMFAERVLAETLNLLRQKAVSALKKRGY